MRVPPPHIPLPVLPWVETRVVCTHLNPLNSLALQRVCISQSVVAITQEARLGRLAKDGVKQRKPMSESMIEINQLR
jgi:hypothetical protein